MSFRKNILAVAVAALALSAHAEESITQESAVNQAPAAVETAVTADADAPATDSAANVLPNVTVSAGGFAAEPVRSTTGLPLTVQDTPQSVSVLEGETIRKFGLDDMNGALELVTGVTVERVETDRTYYTSRGFDIKNMQVDGTGMPLYWSLVVGSVDSAIYEQIEVARGANSLMAGTGNPAGTVNFVRKRPTAEYGGAVTVKTGSFGHQRVEGDVSTPLAEGWASRVVVASDDSQSWLDSYESQRSLFYGVVEGRLSDSTLLTAGYSQQISIGRGVLWGALPLLYSDGTQTDFDISTSTTMDWTFFRNDSRTGFVELLQELSANWNWKTTLMHNAYNEESELFYTYGLPDPVTGLGLYGYPGRYDVTIERSMIDTQVSGSWEAGGRRHDATVGLSVAQGQIDYQRADAPFSDPAWGALPAFPGWNGTEIGRPQFGPDYRASDIDDQLLRLYAATRLSVADDWKLILGANAVQVDTDGYSFGVSQERAEEKISPYVGAVYALTERTNLYASYADVFDPQVEPDVNNRPLGAAKGSSYELGAKTRIGDALIGTVALFRAEQENLAELAGNNPLFGDYFRGTEVVSEGVELELSGKASDSVEILAGITLMEMQDDAGKDTRTYVPRQMVKLAGIWKPVEKIELGSSLRWQGDIYTASTNLPVDIEQNAYALLSAWASWQAAKNLELGLNVDNIGNEKHLTSLYWDQAYYGEPRSVTASMKFSF